ncbi:MAG: PAS domain-containing protein, partial [Kangiellaceae bacterium]|nr:PAS domain-containing protein [Kangiellaceae bacterium]
ENSDEVSSLFKIFSGLISGELERTRNKIQLNLNESIINAIDESVIVTNAHKQIIYANPAFLKCSGYTIDEVMGKDPGNLLRSGKHDKNYYGSMWKSISETGSWSGEITNHRKNGEEFSQWLKIKKVTDIGGSKINYIGIYLDKEELKNIAEQN